MNPAELPNNLSEKQQIDQIVGYFTYEKYAGTLPEQVPDLTIFGVIPTVKAGIMQYIDEGIASGHFDKITPELKQSLVEQVYADLEKNVFPKLRSTPFPAPLAEESK